MGRVEWKGRGRLYRPVVAVGGRLVVGPRVGEHAEAEVLVGDARVADAGARDLGHGERRGRAHRLRHVVLEDPAHVQLRAPRVSAASQRAASGSGSGSSERLRARRRLASAPQRDGSARVGAGRASSAGVQEGRERRRAGRAPRRAPSGSRRGSPTAARRRARGRSRGRRWRGRRRTAGGPP